ncbi:hypothetical protein Slin15195_G084630 [Septoria linicola]|uniref:Uncharacterized protein n=1 Tax=Septoria linicola TaxID=215465 RepID=A0A9Q9ATI5_9PEZI|nr:hypothetical protein Slin14017_G087190 [Septoria linicola]USW55144.1 hypothetical protein Slin15195_G084630 [Septoria linicola]
MLRNIAIKVAIAGAAYAQDDTTTPTVPDTDPRPSSVDPNTIPTVLPTLTLTDNIVTGSVSTQEIVTATGVACIPEGEIIVSIQTDTVLEAGPLTVTPVCGQSVTQTGSDTGSMTTQGIIVTGGGGNASAIATGTNSTVVLTTSLSGTESGLTTLSATTASDSESETTTGSGGASESTSSAAAQTDSPAGRVAAGGAAGLLGLAAGVMLL